MKAFPLVMALVLPGCAGVMDPLSERPPIAGSYFPLGRGAEWTYRVTGSLRSSHIMRLKAPVRITATPLAEKPGQPDLQVWTLEGFLSELAFAYPTANGADIFVQRQVGGAPRWKFVGFARYAWTTEVEWGFETLSYGCVGHSVWTRRTGPERISTPAGTFDCVKLTDGEGVYPTVWLAAGIGLVRREGRVDPENKTSPSEVWELMAYSLPPPLVKDR